MAAFDAEYHRDSNDCRYDATADGRIALKGAFYRAF